MVNKFSYDEYINIVNTIKKSRKIFDFSEINDKVDKFIVIRHDVEFSLERAYNLALLESNELGINSSYFFQIRNNNYNLFSQKNIEIIKKIEKMGHKIGLHVHLGKLDNIESLDTYVTHDLRCMESFLDMPIDRFSYHRPSNKILSLNLEIKNKINVYHSRYFCFKENIKENEKLKIKYIADSMHKWKYGYPDEKTINENDKLQLLFHPYSWTDKGYDNDENFSKLIEEKLEETKQSIDCECKNYNYKGRLL